MDEKNENDAEKRETEMPKRVAYALAGVALFTCGLWLLYRARYGLLAFLHVDPATIFTARYDVMIPALANIIMCGIGLQLVNVTLLRPSTPSRRIVSAILFVGILACSVSIGAGGLIGWLTFAQHDSPADDFAAMVIFPRALQTLLGFGVALCMLLWLAIEFAEKTLFAKVAGQRQQSPSNG